MTHRHFGPLLPTILLAGCGQLGTPEILMILAAIVLLFGATRLPALGRALGETIRGFKQGLDKEGDGKALPPKQKNLRDRNPDDDSAKDEA